MSAEVPLFRTVMGSQNAYFDAARQNDVVLKHVPVDFYPRYQAGEIEALRQEVTDIFHARYPDHGRDITQAWVTRYVNDAARFHEVERARFVTYKAGRIYWAETSQPPRAWRTTTEGDGEVPVQLVARALDRAWTSRTVGGAEIGEVIHPRAFNSLRHNRSELGHANEELQHYFNTLVEDGALTRWHADPDWIRDALRAERTTQSRRAARGPADFLHEFLEEQQLSYEVVRSRRLEGMVYAVSAEELPNWIKVGYTTAPAAADRAAQLQEGNPFRLGVLHAAYSRVAPFAERWAHEHLRDRARGMGEWFNITPPEAKDAIAFGVGVADRAITQSDQS